MPRALHVSLLLVTLLPGACAACARPAPSGEAAAPRAILGAKNVIAELSELELRDDGVDRFVVCPPSVDWGQPWYSAPPSPVRAPLMRDSRSLGASNDANDANPTEFAVESTLRDFRTCYRRGLVKDAAQAGRVAFVLRVAADGRVENVDQSGACELSAASLACMRGVASQLRFAPPAAGSDTVVIPAVFTSRDGVPRASPEGASRDSAGGATGASAIYLAVETLRPAFHQCEKTARSGNTAARATGRFVLMLDARGVVTSTHVEGQSGDESLLACASRALASLTFPRPANGGGVVVARLNFNPRQGGR